MSLSGKIASVIDGMNKEAKGYDYFMRKYIGARKGAIKAGKSGDKGLAKKLLERSNERRTKAMARRISENKRRGIDPDKPRWT